MAIGFDKEDGGWMKTVDSKMETIHLARLKILFARRKCI
jgi:hypothetical protein